MGALGEDLAVGQAFGRRPLKGETGKVLHRVAHRPLCYSSLALIHSAFAKSRFTFWRKARFDAAHTANSVRIACDVNARESIKCAVDVRSVRQCVERGVRCARISERYLIPLFATIAHVNDSASCRTSLPLSQRAAACIGYNRLFTEWRSGRRGESHCNE